MTLSAAAEVQRRLWGTDPRGWAELSEPHNRPLFEAVLDATAVAAGTRLLDLGCGSGLLLEIAAGRGATVAGLDVSPGLLAIARERVTDADLREGEIEELPFEDASFDAVTGVNSFQFAADPALALAEAARVLRPGGLLAASLFASPDRCDGTPAHDAMAALSPPEKEGDHAPYALSEPGRLAATIAAAGLRLEGAGEVECVWRYAGMDDAVRAMTGSAGGARAVADAGREAVRTALEPVLARYRDDAGAIALRNVFRWVSASR